MTDELKKIIYSLHPLERKTLPKISLKEIDKIAKESNLSEAEVTTAVQLLEQKGYAKYEKNTQNIITLDKFGEKFLEKGLPEINLIKEILNGNTKQSQISIPQDEIGAAIGILKRNQLVNISKEDNEMIYSATDKTKEYLEQNQENPLEEFKEDILEENLTQKQKEILNNFKQRKGFLKQTTKNSFSAAYSQKGEEIANEINNKYQNLELIETLDSDMLKNNSYENKEFRHYDVTVDTPIVELGRRHPTIEANKILEDIFVEMGFKEMQGPMVESEFWCFDALWIPQDHPARDEQDTFFLDGESEVCEKLSKQVAKLHEEGLKRGHTPKNGFSQEVTRRRILRTHSTATSFRYLAELGEKQKQGENIDGKYFYVATNFRNEAVDATHLAEFFQGEGFIIGDDLSLADLMGFIKEYYAKLGIHQIRFKPTFNPYTEPSMEAHYYDPQLKKWYSLINSGIFRPETLKAFGLENKTIIAWGMGASRVATLLTGASSMREITGATCDFEWLKTRKLMKREITRGGN